jgi:hypothetical protein
MATRTDDELDQIQLLVDAAVAVERKECATIAKVVVTLLEGLVNAEELAEAVAKAILARGTE